VLLAGCLLLSVGGAALAQSSMPPERPNRKGDPNEFYHAPSTVHGKTILIPIGTTWEGRIDQTISSARSHPGTAFNIVMSSPVLLNGTEVVVPAGSQILGEVVEAVPASRVPHPPYIDKRSVKGKLRISISGLRTPDGVTHPLVASVAGEVDRSNGNYSDYKPPLGTSIGYVGTSSSFEAVNISRSKLSRGDSQDHRPPVIGKRDLLKDPILGAGDDGYRLDRLTIRSLVLNHRDYYIYEGSPITVRLQAPFKMSVATPAMAPLGNVQEVDDQLPPPTRAAGGFGGGAGNGGGDFGGGAPSRGGGGGGGTYAPPSGSSAANDGF
jgi:hypothetical protein